MRAYEAVFILDERTCDDGGEAFAGQFASLVQELGGTVRERHPMGRRQFARPIKKLRSGVYWDFVVDIEPDKVVVMKGRYHLDETVLRLVVMNYVAPPKRKVVLRDDD